VERSELRPRPGPDTPIFIGAILEVIVALACVGTAVVLYAVVLRQHEGDRNGLRRLAGPGSRHHLAGVVNLLSVVTLRQAGARAGALATSQALIAINSWTFLLGQSFLPVVNALLLGSLLYRSCLVARTIPLVELIGAPLLLISDFGVLFALWPQVSALTAISALPIALWGVLAGRLAGRQSFKPSPVTDGMVPAGLPQEDDHGPLGGGSRPEISTA
jgi:hypothetical protein